MEDREELVDALVTASRVLVGVAIRSIAAAHPPVKVSQHRVLVLLAAKGLQQIGDLASELGVNSSNATRHCDRLENKGLVTRDRSSADKRAVRVSLTDQGRDVLAVVTNRRTEEIESIAQRMPSDVVPAMVSGLQAVALTAGEVPDHDWVDSGRPSSPAGGARWL